MFRAPRQRAFAVAVWMGCFVGGNAVGPLVGGVLLAHFWWGSVFLLGVPVMVMLLLVGPVVLPEHRAERPGRLDPASVALSLLAILLAVYGCKELARHGVSAVPVAILLTGIVFGVVFVARQRKLPVPLLDLRLFTHRVFAGGIAVMLCGGIFLGGMTLLVTQSLQVVRGLPPLTAGLLLVPPVAAMTLASLAAPLLARRFRPGVLIATGMAVSAVGYLLLAGYSDTVVLGWTVALAGAGLPAGLAIGLIIAAAPPDRAAAASAVAETSTELGLSLGIALLGSLAMAVPTAGLTTAAVVSAVVSVLLVPLAAFVFRSEMINA